MFGARFYHGTTRRYVAVLGTIFNDIVIDRRTNADKVVQKMKVPISYGPAAKFLSRIEQDPNLDAPAIILPRMSFEITGITYDGERKLPRTNKNAVPLSSNNAIYTTAFTPVPYNIEMQLTIMAKYVEDGTKILEQIVPFFQPEWPTSMKLLDDLEYYLDVPVVLNSISTEDIYEGAYTERRALTWTLNFTIKGWYFGPTSEKKVIKFIEVNLYGNMDAANSTYRDSRITIQPGLHANGSATTILANTIPYTDIEADDDWGVIVTITDNT